jgi:predicted fused transcriptional regulator/phosphomethylpyrimidine kinase
MNIRYFPGLEEIAPLLSLKVAVMELPPESLEIKDRERNLAGRLAAVLKTGGPPPDLIPAPGGWGLEPMLYVLGSDPQAVAEKVVVLKNALSAAGRLL